MKKKRTRKKKNEEKPKMKDARAWRDAGKTEKKNKERNRT